LKHVFSPLEEDFLANMLFDLWKMVCGI
jgi:hypothetical protein